MSRYSRITGTGSYLPPRRLTNADLVAELATQGVDSSDDWIVERTGIRARHFVDAGMSSSDLGVQAALQAMAAAGVTDPFERLTERPERVSRWHRRRQAGDTDRRQAG